MCLAYPNYWQEGKPNETASPGPQVPEATLAFSSWRVVTHIAQGVPLNLLDSWTERAIMNLLKKRGTFNIALLLALSLIVAACGGDDDATTTTAAAQETATTAAVTTTTAAPVEEEPTPETTSAPDDTMADEEDAAGPKYGGDLVFARNRDNTTL